jgi:cytochrome c
LDSYEFNRIAGAVLSALIVMMGLFVLTGYLFHPKMPAKQSYVVEGVVVEAEAGEAAGPAEQPVEFYLASADPARGEATFKKCASCHSITPGGANGIGPNLYGIVGAKHAHAAGFAYSDALKGKSAEAWTWATLDAWIKSPKAALPGNKMAFAGISKPQERADLLVYLNAQSGNPLPIPAAPAAAPAAGPDGSADGAAAEGAVEAPAATPEAPVDQAAEAAPAA